MRGWVGFLVAGMLLSSMAQATIISGTIEDIAGVSAEAYDQGGIFKKLTVSEINAFGGVGNDTLEQPNLFAFDEEQNVVTASAFNYNLGPGGGSGTLAAGTLAASHYIAWDPAGSLRVRGTVTFDAEILAIFTQSATMAATDVLANTGVTYLDPGFRGLESGDSVEIIAPDTIRVDFRAGTPGDYIRVFTAKSELAVPAPTSVLLLLAGMLLGLAARINGQSRPDRR